MRSLAERLDREIERRRDALVRDVQQHGLDGELAKLIEPQIAAMLATVALPVAH